MIFDTHAHYDDRQFEEDRAELLDSMQENGVELIVDAGSDIASWDKIEQLTDRYPFIYGAIGVHPDEVGELNEEKMQQMERLLSGEKMIAVGEIGLDYYWMEDEKEVQKEGFRRQMKLAEKVGLPVVIHSRDAMEDTINILNEFPDVKGVFHCYPGSFESAMLVPDGYVFGIGGVLTFKNARKTVEFIEKIDLSRIVIETDSPYLTPSPFRGKRNEPVYVKYVAEKIAEIKNISVEEVIRITTENAKKIYNIR